MAKWGEGDPRWIVEERPDATNVNNWHWTEKNAVEWSKERLGILFKDLNISESGIGTVTITDISRCEGEATVNNRKGKIIFFYEWSLELEWKCVPEKDPENVVKGKIEILNLSEENEPHEIDISVSISGEDDEELHIKEFLLKKGIKVIQDKVAEYIQALKDEFSSNILLPTKESSHHEVKSKTITARDLANNVKNIKVSGANVTKNNDSVGAKIITTDLTLSQSFKCTAQELYNVFTIREMVCAFTRNDVKLDAVKGGKFELFGGSITGEFIELIPGEKLVQKWRLKTWPSGHHSEVTLTIKEEEDCTRISLNQIGIPSNDFERTKEGWQNYYWNSIKQTFGFGAALL